MTSEEIIKVVEELVGEIHPVADSSIDMKRKENIGKIIDIANYINEELHYIATRFKDSPYASQKEIGIIANQYFKNLTDFNN